MNSLTITRITHCCVLLDLAGRAVLADPWFLERRWYGHGEPVGMTVADLPRLAAITTSHSDLTHCDLDALRPYPHKDVPVLVPRGLVARARRVGFTDVREVTTWDEVALGDLRITVAPARHHVRFDAPFDRSHVVTYVFQAGGWTVYHGGDTMPTPRLEALTHRFPRIDVALLPIAGLRLLGWKLVMSPSDAAQLCALLRPRLAVPTNLDSGAAAWLEGWLLRRTGTPAQFAEAVARLAPSTTVRTLAPGEPLLLDTGDLAGGTGPAGARTAPAGGSDAHPHA